MFEFSPTIAFVLGLAVGMLVMLFICFVLIEHGTKKAVIKVRK